MTNPQNDSVEITIIDEPIRFQLRGLSGRVQSHRYAEVGLRLMDQVWMIVKGAKLGTTGINHWVYLPGDDMFVGIEVRNAEPSAIPEQLEPLGFELNRYAKHLHIGPYRQLPQKWQRLTRELEGRGESVVMPSLEVYGHSCDGADESQAETTILIGLKPKQTAAGHSSNNAAPLSSPKGEGLAT